MYHDPHWPRAHTWLKTEREARSGLAVLGVPLNASISPGRPDLAPGAIRDALKLFSPCDVEHGVDLLETPALDLGDLPTENLTPEVAVGAVRLALTGDAERLPVFVLLGGDNAVTRPGVHALGLPLSEVGVITLDAHFDLRSLENGLHNGNPIWALLEDGLPGRNIVQLGIQNFANSAAYAEVAAQADIEVITAERLQAKGAEETLLAALAWLENRVSAIYVDLDIDVLDRAACPGAPGARPGGLHPWQVRRMAYLLGRHPKVRAMDIVELDPERDINQVTALAAAASLLSFASGVACR